VDLHGEPFFCLERLYTLVSRAPGIDEDERFKKEE